MTANLFKSCGKNKVHTTIILITLPSQVSKIGMLNSRGRNSLHTIGKLTQGEKKSSRNRNSIGDTLQGGT